MTVIEQWRDFINFDGSQQGLLFSTGEHSLYFKGYWFNPPRDLEQFCRKLLKNPGSLSSIEGEFALLCRDSEGTFVAATDKIGAIKLYYSTNSGTFSTNFWWLVDTEIRRGAVPEPDKLGIKELIFYHHPLFGRSILKGYGVVPAGMYILGNSNSGELDLRRYYTFKFGNQVTDVKYAAELLNRAINRTMRIVTERHRNSKFGVGISGGIDSRIIPHYLLKSGIPRQQIRGFIIGNSKPRRFFYSDDHRIALRIAKYYGITLEPIEYYSEPILQKALLDVYASPLRTSNMLKATFHNDFDILITGAYGTIVGGHIISPKVSEIRSDNELAEYIMRSFSLLKKRKSAGETIKELVGSGFRWRGIYRHVDEIPPLLTKTENKRINEDIMSFISNERKLGKNNYDIIVGYHLSLSSHGGAFESLSNRKPAFSIYYPYGLEWLQNVTPEIIMERKALKHLLRAKVPALSDVPGQGFEVSGMPARLRKALNLLIRGYSLDYASWVRSKYFLEFAKDTLEKENPLFEEVFGYDGREIFETLFSTKQLHPWIFENTVKVKLMLDIIHYKDFGMFKGVGLWPKSFKLNARTG